MKNKILFVLSLLFGLMFINGGLNKFFNYMPVPEDMPQALMDLMMAFQQSGWLLPLLGLVEVVAGVLIIFKKTRALGAIMILPVMVGIVLTHIFNAPSGLPVALVLMAILLWILYENKGKYSGLIE